MLSKYFCFITTFFVFSFMCQAAQFEAGSGKERSAIRSVYDGDTFNLAFRLAGIDTPEIKGKCAFEKRLAIKARDFSRRFFQRSEKVELTVVGVGNYGRPLVVVKSSRGTLNNLLLTNGLAKPYEGRRYNWCDN